MKSPALMMNGCQLFWPSFSLEVVGMDFTGSKMLFDFSSKIAYWSNDTFKDNSNQHLLRKLFHK